MEKLTLFFKILAWINICIYILAVYKVNQHNRALKKSSVMRLLGAKPANIKGWATLLMIISVVFLIVFW